jgi:hypothetical protein
MATKITVDKVRFKRGLTINMPTLYVGEPYFAEDTDNFWMGTNNGNVNLSKNEEYSALVKLLNQLLEPTTLDSLRQQSLDLNVFKFGYVDSKIAATNLLIDGVNAEIDGLHTDIGTVNGSIATVQGEVDTVNDELDIHDLRVQDSISIEEYGVVGDGIVDDTVNFQRAIDDTSAKKKKLLLGAGKTYLITSPLSINAQSAIIGHASHRPIIRVKSQSFNPITANGTLVVSTKLRSSATVNTKWVDVTDATGITAGMLVEVVSSLPWYHDPRTDSSDCRKAELHRVDEVDGNRLHFTDPLMDGYDLTKETVDINAYTAIRVHMENLELLMDKGAEPNDSIRYTGIQLRYTIDSLLKDVYVSNASNCGISLYHSYAPTVDGGRTIGANNYFAGYGVQTYGTTHAVVKNRHFRNCRRGVDVSGGRIPSHYTVVEGCRAFGNGLNSLLNRYGFNDDHTTGTYACGFGTHGGADYTIFRNNYMGFLHYGLENRSRNTIMEGNLFVGDFYISCIDNNYGENTTIRGNKTYDGFTGLKEAGIFDGGANVNTRKPERFITVRMDALVNGSSGGFFLVEDNFCMIRDSFLSLSGDSTVTTVVNQKNFIVKNNHAMFNPQLSASDCYFVKNDSYVTTIMLSGSTFRGNTYERVAGTGNLYYLYGCDLRTASETENPRTFSFFLSDDTASSILLGNNTTNWARVTLDSNAVYGSVRVTNGTNSSLPIGTPSTALEVNSVALLGTTGTDGKISLSLVNGKLYVENRYGSSQRIMITVMNYM